ncbi:ABC transporter permease [Fulvivirga lutimaris]|uniref:ABC transporter permease n=1 Tax=Fulvivirga lutimaris TaxID=1819566 RepID=UPI0012BD2FAC|nr:ABC transporter permease [Fulvivirga lutimaris]MTI41985.1 ABC transporter permease [Fulvivirga lutimaris]
MLKYYVIATYRNLKKRPFFLMLNVLGLTLGVLISTLIALYVNTEFSTDKGLAKSEHIYRLLRNSVRDGQDYRVGVTSGPFAEALVNDFPNEVESTLRVMPTDGLVSVNDETHYNEDFFYLADSNFFEFFNYEFVYGDASTSFTNPQSVILTEATSKRLYGDKNPINKTIRLDRDFEFIVTGVIKVPVVKSHLDFNMISRIDVIRNFNFFKQWWSNNLVTYVKVSEASSQTKLEALFPGFMEKYFGEDFIKTGRKMGLELQKIRDMYFDSDVQYDNYVHGNIDTVYIFLWVGIFLIVIACINFVNLTTAVSSLRSKEVGVRKILGSNKKQLLTQYMLEAFAICGFSVIVGFMLVEILLPQFNSLYNLDLQINWFNKQTIIYGSSTVLILVTLSGVYPALLLSSFNPLNTIKGKVAASGTMSALLRKGLVIFQFTCSILLFIATLVISGQMSFLSSKPLGFDKEYVVLINNNNQDLQSNLDLFTERVEQVNGVQTVSTMTGEPGGFHDTNSLHLEGNEDGFAMRTVFCDASYFQTFGLEMSTGRFFRKDNQPDLENAIVINETASKSFGFATPEDALGKRLKNQFADSAFREIIGVVKDYNFSSLKDKMEALVLSPSRRAWKIAIKLSSTNVQQQLADIEVEYKRIVNVYPFEYQFLDAKIEAMYNEEVTQKNIFILFSLTSIGISCLGILGLAAFTANQRSKEISIRKVLGASVYNISLQLSSQFTKLVLAANLIAWPLAWLFADEWLSNFAYSISLNPFYFIIAGVATLIIALLTILYQSLSAAISNPIDALKEE